MRIVRPMLFAATVLAAASSLLTATAAQMADTQPGETTVMTESAAPGQPGECGCRSGQPQQSWQQPPWHGNVQGGQCGARPAGCRGSSVYQAHPFQQLQWKHSPCVKLPPHFPRLHAMCRDGSMPSPVPPAQPRCHQCGAAIEGGF